ncbi:MAG: ASKHA domain-containing protein, partial [Thermofilaceae archaeon]
GGLGLCGLCKLKVKSSRLSEPTEREKKLLGDMLRDGWRLACQIYIIDDTSVELMIKKKGFKFRIRPSVKVANPLLLVPVNVSNEGESIEEELFTTLQKLGAEVNRSTTLALNKMALTASREGVSKVAVIAEKELLDLAEDCRGYGLAVDVGTTSIAVSLVDLTSGELIDERATLNSQIRFGSDVISRIQYSLVHHNGVKQLQESVISTVNQLVNEIGVPATSVYKVTVSGNSVMLHLFYGVTPKTLGFLPFKPVYRRGLIARAGELGLKAHPCAKVESLPILGGYVGGDVVGDVLAAELFEYRTAMLIDVGTNGEVVIKKNDQYVAASTPAGPAFEGVGLYSGMMAIEGAIEKVGVEPDGKTAYEVIGEGPPRGICGSGYVDLLAELLRKGLLTREGRLLSGPGVREVNGVTAFLVDEEHGILLTQPDVRKLQLAVAAVKLTAKFAMEQLGVELCKLEKVIVAGDFGYHLDPCNAIEIGLLPKVDRVIVEFIGNGSLTGAELYMVSNEARQKVWELLGKCRVLDVPRDEKAFINELKLGW